VIVSLPVSAHHSFAMFDDTKEVTLKGTVHEFQWTNPHAWVLVDVAGAGGETEQWSVEMLSPNVLGRMGWKRNSLKPGDEVTVVIHPVRTGAKGGNMVSVRDKSGAQIGGPQQ
jgi:hypothetical protein